MNSDLSKTPAPKKDKIFGSKVNPKGSASSEKSANSIVLNDNIILSLSKKLKKFKQNYPNSENVGIADLKAVYRRGLGAYSSSHRPTISGGKPNTRNAWAMARVNKFLQKAGGNKVKKSYVQDDDLLKFKEGGKIELLAPNGKPSNLTPEQYKLVRTKEFKEWFGYWENDLENASKVVDENGEPLVVYHGTQQNIRIKIGIDLINKGQFDKINKIFKNYKYPFTTFDKKNKSHSGTIEDFMNIWFTDKFSNALGYSYLTTDNFGNKDGANFYDGEFYINGEIIEKKNGKWVTVIKKENLNYNIDKKERGHFVGYVFDCFLNIKNPLKIDFNKEFYKNKTKVKIDEIEYEEELNYFVIKAKNENYDGLIVENINDKGSTIGEDISNDYVCFNSTQIKLADGSNKTFDGSNPDIRFEQGGVTAKSLINSMPNELRERFVKLWNIPQRKDYHPEGNTLKHAITVVRRAIKNFPNDKNVIAAALFHDIGKDKAFAYHKVSGEPTAYGHEDISADLVLKYKDWIQDFGADVDVVYFLVKNHMKAHRIAEMKFSKQQAIQNHPYYNELMKLESIDKSGLHYEDGGTTLTEKEKIEKENFELVIRKYDPTFKISDAEFLRYQKGVSDRLKSTQQKQFTYREIKDIANKVKGASVAGAKAEYGGGYTTLYFYKYTDADSAIAKLRKEGYKVSDRQRNPANTYSRYMIKVEKPIPTQEAKADGGKIEALSYGGEIPYNTKTILSSQTDFENSFKLQLFTKNNELIGIFYYYIDPYDFIPHHSVEVNTKFKGLGFGKELLLKAIKVANDYDLGFVMDSNMTNEQKRVYDSLYRDGYIDGAFGTWSLTDKGEDLLANFVYKNGGEVDDHKETYAKWKSLVNMSKSELEKFYNSEEGKVAGMKPSEAKSQGIDSGRESARWIMKMKDTSVSEWTPEMWKWAKKQISFISRMSGNKGSLYDDKGKKTRKHLSLLIWGNNPDKKNTGGIMNKYEISDYWDADKFGGGGEVKTKKIITDKIGWNDEVADYFIEQNPKLAIWFADAIMKREIKSIYGSSYFDANGTFGGGYVKIDNDKVARKYIKELFTTKSKISSNYGGSIRRILDWLQHPITEKQNLRELSFDEAIEKEKQFHNELKVIGGDIDFVEPEENEILLKYPIDKDGAEFYWVHIPSNFCNLESSRMGHCGRTGHGNTLISLRSIRPYGKGHTINDSHVTIAYNEDEGFFYQVKGKKNQKPSEKYYPYIFNLIKKFAEIEKFNGFRTEYGSSEDYSFVEMTKAQIEELYEINPNIFVGLGGEYVLYEKGVISQKPNTKFILDIDVENIYEFFNYDGSKEFLKTIVSGDLFGLFDSYSRDEIVKYYLDDLNKENMSFVLDEISKISGIPIEEVKENGANYYLSDEYKDELDEDFDFDSIVDAIGRAVDNATQNNAYNYYYKEIKRKLSELGEVLDLNDEGVKIEVDLSELLSINQIAAYASEFGNDLEAIFFEAEYRGDISFPKLIFDDRYSPYADYKQINEYFEPDFYENGGTLFDIRIEDTVGRIDDPRLTDISAYSYGGTLNNNKMRNFIEENKFASLPIINTINIGDKILLYEDVFSGSLEKPKHIGYRYILCNVIDIDSASKILHLEVVKSVGVNPLKKGSVITRHIPVVISKGRKLFSNEVETKKGLDNLYENDIIEYEGFKFKVGGITECNKKVICNALNDDKSHEFELEHFMDNSKLLKRN